MADNPQKAIENKWLAIRTLQSEIDDIGKAHIPEFHFLDHQISNFWTCEKSPIGWCVWDISEKGFNINVGCYYCGQPVERK